jgi:hypothetical protein
MYPVFARGQDGKIGVFKLVWPSYWAAMKGDSVTPLDLDTVKAATSRVITKAALSKVGDWPDLKQEDIAKILSMLGDKVPEGAKPVYVTGSRLYSLNGSGQLASAEHKIASPYMWPIAHDVRPAAQSLGVRNCQDCHSTDAPFFFGKVAVDSPLKTVETDVEMVKFEELPRLQTKLFAFSLVFKPLLKVVSILSAFIIAAVLLLYGLKALNFFTKYFNSI